MEFSTFMGSQFKAMKKLLIKFERATDGDEGQVEGMVRETYMTVIVILFLLSESSC